jgi:hypothetical protein
MLLKYFRALHAGALHRDARFPIFFFALQDPSALPKAVAPMCLGMRSRRGLWV